MTPSGVIRSLLEASTRGELTGNEERWFSRGIIQVEWPNRLDPKGSTRDFEELQAFHRRLEQDCIRRRFELTNLVVAGEQVAAEMVFQLTFGSSARGPQDGLRGNLALFSWLEHERIVRQHLYMSIVSHA